jgi:hypothetical protein
MTLLSNEKLDGVVTELVCEINRHLNKPITKGMVRIPLVVDDDIGNQIALKLAFMVRTTFTDGQMLDLMTHKVHVRIVPEARKRPYILRGDTALIYVHQPLPDDHEDLVHTMENTLFTARFKGLGGHIVRI